MVTSRNTYHHEYSCARIKRDEQQVSACKPITHKKTFWFIYGTLLLAGLYLFPFWLSVLVYMLGILLMPTSPMKHIQVTDPPFLVIDTKYIQFRERVVSWSTVDSVSITQEIVKKKAQNCDWVILIKSNLGKEVRVETFHFEKKDEIIRDILLLAKEKEIHIKDERPCHNSTHNIDYSL